MEQIPQRLTGKVVVVTGSTRGLGAAMAKRFAAEGAAVVVSGRHVERGRAVEQEIRDEGGQARYIRCDASDEAAVRELVSGAVEVFGTITGLVNSAYSHPGFHDLLETPEKQLRRSIDVILFGTLEVTRAVVPHMSPGSAAG